MRLAITTWPTQEDAAPTELGSAFGGGRGYKHGAPDGACRLGCPQRCVRSGHPGALAWTLSITPASVRARPPGRTAATERAKE